MKTFIAIFVVCLAGVNSVSNSNPDITRFQSMFFKQIPQPMAVILEESENQPCSNSFILGMISGMLQHLLGGLPKPFVLFEGVESTCELGPGLQYLISNTGIYLHGLHDHDINITATSEGFLVYICFESVVVDFGTETKTTILNSLQIPEITSGTVIISGSCVRLDIVLTGGVTANLIPGTIEPHITSTVGGVDVNKNEYLPLVLQSLIPEIDNILGVIFSTIFA